MACWHTCFENLKSFYFRFWLAVVKSPWTPGYKYSIMVHTLTWKTLGFSLLKASALKRHYGTNCACSSILKKRYGTYRYPIVVKSILLIIPCTSNVSPWQHALSVTGKPDWPKAASGWDTLLDQLWSKLSSGQDELLISARHFISMKLLEYGKIVKWLVMTWSKCPLSTRAVLTTSVDLAFLERNEQWRLCTIVYKVQW